MPPMAAKPTCIPDAILLREWVSLSFHVVKDWKHVHVRSGALAADVVCLPRKDRGQRAVGTCKTEEGTEVSARQCEISMDHQ
jgi:hypothetical protein